MGKETGFLEFPRQLPKKRDTRSRLDDWKEFYLPQSVEQVRLQGARCMDCGIPFCQQGCPLGNQIPDWNDLVYRDQWRAAHHRLAATNNFPEFTGRLCPAPCEAACVLSINADPVTIEEIEKQIIERAFAEGWVVPQLPRQRSDKHVAVVGSGPAGLAAAAQLNHVGHRVTVYERDDRLGGLLRYGIPDFKMEKWVIDRRLDVMEAEGVRFVTGTDVGTSVGWDELHARHDAVVVAVGAGRPRDLRVPGRELRGVVFAMDFLTQQNRRNAGLPVENLEISAEDKQVIILGGGDTGSDCLGTALRQGAARVHQIELLPRPPEMRAEDNRWPQWPMIYRTSSSQEEGGERDYAVLTKRLTGKGSKLSKLHGVRIEMENGRIREQMGTELTIEVDLLILAMGFVGPVAERLTEQLGIRLDARGNVATDARYMTSVDGVFAAGDANRGQSLIVWAISEGREAARHVDLYLRATDRAALPTRGIDQPFEGS